MPDSFILDMPMELGLKLMAPVRAYRMDPEWEPLQLVIDKRNRTLLVMSIKHLERSNPRGIFDRGVLKTANQAGVRGL